MLETNTWICIIILLEELVNIGHSEEGILSIDTIGRNGPKKLKNYIDNYNNGVDMDWENNHSADYEKDADKVHSKKYIYYR